MPEPEQITSTRKGWHLLTDVEQQHGEGSEEAKARERYEVLTCTNLDSGRGLPKHAYTLDTPRAGRIALSAKEAGLLGRAFGVKAPELN